MITEFEAMVQDLKKPGKDLLQEWTPEKASATHMLVGLIDEVFEYGEAVDVIYNSAGGVEFSQIPEKFKEAVGHLIEETGDALFYIKGLEQDLGLRPLDFNLNLKDLPDLTMDTTMLAVVTPIKRHLYYFKDLDKEGLAKALEVLAATLLYFPLELGASLEMILNANMNKLTKGDKARYKNGFSNEAANKRADKE